MKGRGQVFSGEFLLSYILFIAALILVIYLWNSSFREIAGAETHRDSYNLAVDAAEVLVKTRGSPVDWDRHNVSSFGLVNESRILKGVKIVEFLDSLDASSSDSLCAGAGASNYECRKHILVKSFDVWVNFTYLNGSTVVWNNTVLVTGRMPENETELFRIQRNAVLDDEIVRMDLEVWR